MSEMIDTAAAVRLLQGIEDVAILCHKSPDGDTLGCGFALLYALQKLGKRAVVLCKDPLPDRYAYLGEGTHTEPPFVPKAVVAVDTASDALLGEPLQLPPSVQHRLCKAPAAASDRCCRLRADDRPAHRTERLGRTDGRLPVHRAGDRYRLL